MFVFHLFKLYIYIYLSRWITPEEYKAEDNTDGWFMREEQHKLIDKRFFDYSIPITTLFCREVLSQRASYLNRLGRHDEALKVCSSSVDNDRD